MDELKFSRYFQEEYFPISVTVMPAREARKNPPHSHEFSELVLISAGHLHHHCCNMEVKLKEGDFLLIHPGTVHYYSKLSRNLKLYNLIYDASIPIPMLMISNSPFIQRIYPVVSKGSSTDPLNVSNVPKKDLPSIVNKLEEIRHEVRNRAPGSQLLITTLFMEILQRLARHYSAPSLPESKWTLDKVVGFMKCHYNEKLSVIDLAKFAGMSERTLFRNFKSVFGIGPADYLTSLRVRQAISLLKNRELTLEAIASECGFCDKSHLWKTLKKKLDLTPADIRRQNIEKPYK